MPENWWPTGSEAEFTLSRLLKPLEPMRDRVLVLGGVDYQSKSGEQNQAGLIAWLTGTGQNVDAGGFASGPSLDQVLAPRLSPGRLSSLQLAVRWGTGKAHGLASPIDIANYANTPQFEPIPPQLDPAKIWQQLFGAVPTTSPESQWDRSILDAVDRRYAKLAARLGAEDRQRLEAHLTTIRELEQRLGGPAADCTPPELTDTSDYDPLAGLKADDTGQVVDLKTDTAIPKVGQLMMDMLVMALSCDITSVASLQWSDVEAKHTFPWLGLNEHMHFYMNDGGYHPEELSIIYEWYSQQHAYLLARMAETPGEQGSLLDESIVFFGTNVGHPATHAGTDIPLWLAGNGGGLRTGRWVTYDHPSHNDLLVALANLCGDERTTFGDARYCTGPLGGLT